MTDRKADILRVGVSMWPDVSARRIARSLNTSHSAILYYFGSAAALRDAVADEAVRSSDARVVPMLITARHTSVAGLSEAARQEYLQASCAIPAP